MKVTAQLMDENRYSASCQIWNNDMTKLVNECKQEEIAWYNSPRITENGFITTTQNLWYTHCLNKKRLMALGLTAHYDYIKPTEYEKSENQSYPYWKYSHDGKNLICKISDEFHYRKSIYNGNHCFTRAASCSASFSVAAAVFSAAFAPCFAACFVACRVCLAYCLFSFCLCQ